MNDHTDIVEKTVDLVLNGKFDANILIQLADLAEFLASKNKFGEFVDGWKSDAFPMFADFKCRELNKIRTAIGRRLKEEAYKSGCTYLQLFRLVAAFDLLYYRKENYRPMVHKNGKMRFVWHYWNLLEDGQYRPEVLSFSCKQMTILDRN